MYICGQHAQLWMISVIAMIILGAPARTTDTLVSRSNVLDAGLGPELETSWIQLKAEKECSLADTVALKGAPVGNYRSDKWNLTGDSTPVKGGLLNIEIIGDGRKIKLGTGDVEQTIKDIRDRMISWFPDLAKLNGRKVQIAGSRCGDWIFIVDESRLAEGLTIQTVGFEGHFTTPLALETIHDIFTMASTSENSLLLPNINRDHMIAVNKDFFQSSPNGIDQEDVPKDVLGLLSMIVSYVKGIGKIAQENSPKLIIQIMPRTDFTALLSTIEGFDFGPLFELVEVLTCYEGYGKFSFLDDEYCDGDEEEPVPNGKLKSQKFIGVTSRARRELLVQAWLKDLHCFDLLARLDEIVFVKQLGGLRDRLERLFGSNREVGIYEIRASFFGTLDEVIPYILSLEQAVLESHRKYPEPPRPRAEVE